jgi:hypothetical protein
MRLLSAISLLVVAVACSPVEQDDLLSLTGTYLGQTPPGADAELFAPGIVSTGLPESGIAISPDGNEIFWTVFVKGLEVIITTRNKSEGWTEPEVAPFASRFNDGWPAFHPDGSKLYFHSHRALDGSDTKVSVVSIWYVEKTETGWSNPMPVPGEVNGNGFVCCATASDDGTLYYSKKIEGGEIIYRSRFVNGRYVTPEPLPETVNAGPFQIHAVIAPNESYLVLPLARRDDLINSNVNYYVFFRSPDDIWSGPVNLGEAVNNGRTGGTPSISSDGEYLFFEANSGRDYLDMFDSIKTYAELKEMAISLPDFSHRTGDIYWISSRIVEDLRPDTE